jgi:hypothetical protein
VYGDYCSGEIFIWDGATQITLFDTTMNISSFGEDEQGELYVVDLRGTVSKVTVSLSHCAFIISSASQTFGPGGGTGSVAVTAPAGCLWNAVSSDSWIHVTSGAAGSASGTVAYAVDQNPSQSPRAGAIVIAGDRRFAVNQDGAMTARPFSRVPRPKP